MAALPLALALGTASAAYANARWSVSHDLDIASSLLAATIRTNRAAKNGRLNPFYMLEERALSKADADHIFLVVPPVISTTSQQKIEDLRHMICEEYTYRNVYDIVLQYAAWLKNEHAIKKGDIVAIDLKNTPRFVYMWFALWSLGARPAFINTALRGAALLHCVKISQARLFVADLGMEDILSAEVTEGLGPEVTSVVLSLVLEQTIRSFTGHRACDDCRKIDDGSDMAQLIFTSGTTGMPKAAIVDWARWYTSSRGFATWVGVKMSDRFYTAMPLYHSSASILGLGAVLSIGGTIVISPRFSPRTFLASVIATRATAIQYVGEMCRYLLATPPSPLDRAHTIRVAFGNGIRPDVWEKFKDRFGIPIIAEFYGATESPTSSMIKSHNTFGAGAIGRTGPILDLVRGRRTLVVRHNTDSGEPYRASTTGLCEKCDTGEVGELLARLDPEAIKDRYLGYWANEKASESKILRDVLVRGDVYFRTGDLIRRDREGRTFFVDRVGDTFRWKGENVSAGEVEAVVAGCGEVVSEACVYGVEIPGHDGRAGCAAVVLKDGVSPRALSQLATWNLSKLPRYAVPIFVRVVDKLEVTGTNKVQKQQLRNGGVDPASVKNVFMLDPGQGTYEPLKAAQWQSFVSKESRL